MTDPVLSASLSLALADRYRFERELGRGGMAAVFLAHDLRHERPVAIKVLRPDLAAAIGADRFAREIRLLARLRHPFILPLHDSGEAEGSLYFVMPYIDGESLGARITRTGPLPVAEALGLARNIADALGYAHAEGIVHRDVKPENVLITRQGHALLADFGIARGHPAAPGGARVTAIGLAVGTPAYMSPEQVMGDEPAAASDIYSLGVTLFEMLAGRPPFVSEGNSAGVAMQHVIAPVPTFASVGVSVPAPIEDAVRRALAKDPADRFPTVAEFAAALSAPGHTAAAPTFPASPAPPASVVVLPLTNISGDQESEYLSDGITDELIGALARVSGLRVISRTSAFAFKGKRVPLREIGTQLQVAFALEGGVRRSGDRLRVSAQLIRVSDDSSVWSETYERRMADVFDVQDDITRRIVATMTRTLKVTSVDTPEPMAKPRNVEAYHDYLLGRYHWNKRTKAGLEEAAALFRRVIAADPEFAPAYSGLADTLAVMVSKWVGPPTLYPTALEAARRAVALDPSLAEAHASLGYLKLNAEWDWSGAERELRQAIAINPSYIPARHWLSAYLAATGRIDEALPLAEAAVQLDPLSILARINLGTVNMYADRFVDAERHFQQAVAMEPAFESAQTWLALAQASQGRDDDAIATTRVAVALGEPGPAEAFFALIFGLLGRPAEAEVILLKHLDTMARVPLFVAFVYATMNRDDEAFAWLERGVAERGYWMYSIGGQPSLRRYRNDPRFLSLLDRLGLPRPKGAPPRA